MQLEIVGLTGPTWPGRVREVTLPGAAGEFGVLRGHTTLLATLREGVHVHPHDAQALEIHVSGGCVEAQPEQAMVLADRDRGLDAARAAAARDQARSPMFMAFAEQTSILLHAELMRRYSARHRQIQARQLQHAHYGNAGSITPPGVGAA
ncbi:ATP synthase F1 subunit epsilon [Xanthomonas campestris pv. phormiicola]|nr:ATP synthase F1 subunit epsilon [Xanthomonas campestris pv. phormiicola]UYC15686.1 ATP synthase F1 subunit epsilon [Xanthomonas campestris pv. phormiicola]